MSLDRRGAAILIVAFLSPTADAELVPEPGPRKKTPLLARSKSEYPEPRAGWPIGSQESRVSLPPPLTTQVRRTHVWSPL